MCNTWGNQGVTKGYMSWIFIPVRIGVWESHGRKGWYAGKISKMWTVMVAPVGVNSYICVCKNDTHP